MSDVSDAAGRLIKAIGDGTRLSTSPDPGATLASLPAAILGAPRLRWEAGRLDPTDAEFPVYVIVAADEQAVESLWDIVTEVSVALDTRMPDAAVTDAAPGVFPSGTSQLPCYEITVEVGL